MFRYSRLGICSLARAMLWWQIQYCYLTASLITPLPLPRQGQGQHWREALRILKLAVAQSSSLAAAPSSGSAQQTDTSGIHVSFVEAEVGAKKELPGRLELWEHVMSLWGRSRECVD